MMGSRWLRGRPADILDEINDLHAQVERELQSVAVAVSDLDGFFFSPTRASSLLSADNRCNTCASGEAARAFAGRRLHSILNGGRSRILSALTRQRILLWEFLRDEYPGSGNKLADGGGGSRNQTLGPTASRSSTNLHHRGSRGVPHGLDWTRHTLVGMNRLLRRKAGDQNATAADRAAISRDMAKIEAALKRLDLRVRSTGGGVPRVPPASAAAGSTRISLTCATSEEIPSAPEATKEWVDSTGASGGNVLTAADSGPSLSEPCRLEVGHEHDAATSCSDALSIGGRRLAIPLLREVEVRLPDGLDVLLRRIEEGVRPSNRAPAPAETPTASLWTQPVGGKTTPSVPKVETPRFSSSETPVAGARQEVIIHDGQRASGGCSKPRAIGVGARLGGEGESVVSGLRANRGGVLRVRGNTERCGDGEGTTGGRKRQEGSTGVAGFLSARHPRDKANMGQPCSKAEEIAGREAGKEEMVVVAGGVSCVLKNDGGTAMSQDSLEPGQYSVIAAARRGGEAVQNRGRARALSGNGDKENRREPSKHVGFVFS